MRFLIFAIALGASSAVQADCNLSDPCPIANRSYHIREPDAWDGTSPLPVLLHFHGWGRQGDLVVAHDRIASATRKRGVLLVAPNGLGRSWSFWSPTSRDTSFTESVLAELRQRYPIDDERIFVSGYSYGGAMAWRFACETKAKVAALLSISGTIDQNTNCARSPADVHHVHGLADTVMDYPLGPDQDMTYPVALWRRALTCGAPQSRGPWQARSWLTFDRIAWECDAGHVTLDIHSGGHFIPHGWIGAQLDDLLGLPRSYP